MKNCVPILLAHDGKHATWRCGRCEFMGRDIASHVPSGIRRKCGVQVNGIGDHLALLLAKCYITKARVDRFLATVDRWRGKPPQEQQAGCGCTVRQQALNRWGWSWQERANKVGWYFRHRLAWLSGRCRR